MARRFGSLALAIGIVTVSVFGMLIGAFWGFGLQCDDSCGEPPPWRDDPNAWQWEALGILGIAGLACGFVFLLAVGLRRKFFALAALATWAVLAGYFLRILDESGLTSNVERGWAGLVVFVIAGLAAIALAPRRSRSA